MKQTEGTLFLFQHVRPCILDMPSQHSGPVLKCERNSGGRCCLNFIRPIFSTVLTREKCSYSFTMRHPKKKTQNPTMENYSLMMIHPKKNQNSTMEKRLLQPHETPKVASSLNKLNFNKTFLVTSRYFHFSVAWYFVGMRQLL